MKFGRIEVGGEALLMSSVRSERVRGRGSERAYAMYALVRKIVIPGKMFVNADRMRG